MGKIATFLSRPWSLPVLALIGVLLYAPGMGANLIADDFFQWALLKGDLHQAHYPGSPFGLFNLVDGSPEHVQAMKDSGRLFWGAADTLRMSFWRPLAEFTHWVDFKLWPDSPLMMHVHSLLWYGLLLLSVGLLYKRLTTSPVQAGLAMAIYAMSSLHLMAVTWLAARNQLMSVCFTSLTVICYHDWRSGRGAIKGWLAALSLLLALASAEASVAAMAYLVAHAATIESDRPVRERLLALSPFLIITAVWRVACTRAGYGSFGSGSYIDPIREPLRFGETLLVRLPALLVAQLFGMPSAAVNNQPYQQQAMYAVFALAASLFVLWMAWRAGLWQSKAIRFFALGTILALVPVCAILPQDRVLIHAEIGVSGVLSLLCVGLLARLKQDRQSVGWLPKVVIGLMMTVHLLIFPVSSLALTTFMGAVLQPMSFNVISDLPKAAGQAGARVVFINPPMPNMLFYYPQMRSYMGLTNSKSSWALANGMEQSLMLTVIDESTIRLSSQTAFVERLHRDTRSQPFKAGDVVALDGLTITVEKVSADNAPLVALFHFDKPLSDPQWQFYVWDSVGYARFNMPAPGRMVAMPAVNMSAIVKQSLQGLRMQRRHASG